MENVNVSGLDTRSLVWGFCYLGAIQSNHGLYLRSMKKEDVEFSYVDIFFLSSTDFNR